jgi:rhodanese-related sulfurtransferase
MNVSRPRRSSHLSTTVIKLARKAKAFLFLVVVASVPAIAQLSHSGFSPPAEIPFGISIEEALTHPKTIVWIDARDENTFEIAHVPGALNINRINWNLTLPSLFAVYVPGKNVIVYCSPDCSESEEIAARIRELGFEHVFVLEGGYAAWKQAQRGS